MKKIILLCSMLILTIGLNASQVNFHQSDQLQTFGFNVQSPAQAMPFTAVDVYMITAQAVLTCQIITAQNEGLIRGQKGVTKKVVSDFDYGNTLKCAALQKRLIQSFCSQLRYKYSPIGLAKDYSKMTKSTVRHV